MSVPKKLHFVWVGDENKCPAGCIASWKSLNPDYEIFVWGERELWGNSWVNKRHMEAMYEHELCGVADLMRYEILLAEGGVALDADSLCVRPLEDWVIEPNDFTCWSNEIHLGQLLANGVMGASPRSPYVAEVIARIHDKRSVIDERAWISTGPTVTTRVWKDLRYPLTVWPSHLFLPDFHSGEDYGGQGAIFARQFYGSTYNGLRPEADAYDRIKTYSHPGG